MALKELTDKLHIRAKHRNSFRDLILRHLCLTIRNMFPSAVSDQADVRNVSDVLQSLTPNQRQDLIRKSTLSFMDQHGLRLWPGSKRGHLTSESTVRKNKNETMLYTSHGVMLPPGRRAFRKSHDREPDAVENQLGGVIGSIMSAYFTELLALPDLITVNGESGVVSVGNEGEIETLLQVIVGEDTTDDRPSAASDGFVYGDEGDSANREDQEAQQ